MVSSSGGDLSLAHWGRPPQRTVVSSLQTSFLSLPSGKTPYPRLTSKAPASGAPLQPVPLLGFCFLPAHGFLYTPQTNCLLCSKVPIAPPHIQAEVFTAALIRRHCLSFDSMLLFAEPKLIHLLMFFLLYIANMC